MRIGTTISAIILSLLFASVLPAAQQGFTNNLGMKFVYIRPGSFVMGSPSGESGRGGDETQHRVSLTKGFYLQATEVTQGQWEQVMGSRPWSGKNYVRENANNPASYVSWNDCQAFIRKLNGMEGSRRVPVAHGNGVGICLPGRLRQAVLFRKQRRPAWGLCLV